MHVNSFNYFHIDFFCGNFYNIHLIGMTITAHTHEDYNDWHGIAAAMASRLIYM